MIDELVIRLVSSYLTNEECQKYRSVSRFWDQAFGRLLIERINQGASFVTVLPKIRSYENLKTWLERNQRASSLTNADFRGMSEMRNGDWSKLGNLCADISKLNLNTDVQPEHSMLSKKGLGELGAFSKLRILDLSGNSQFFGEDVAPFLQATTSLEKVNFLGLIYLMDGNLNGLAQQCGLKELNIAGCAMLSPNFLNILAKLPDLRVLNIEDCAQFERKSLENLRHTPLLEKINFIGCWRLGVVNIALLPPTKLLETKAVLGEHTFIAAKL